MAEEIKKNLIESGVLEQLRINKNKYSTIKESRSLIAIYEQQLFAWSDANSCIISAEISDDTTVKENRHKELMLSSTPVFDVESILFNNTGSLLVLSGRNGVMIYEVPWRYGKFSASNMSQKSIIGRSWNIDERLYTYSSKVSIVQASWHPGSPSNAHLTVLSTDNYIRTYEVTDPQVPLQVISLGSSLRSSYLSSESKISFSTCYGENSVSFDFGMPEEIDVPDSNSIKTTRKIESATVWPIYLLHGNGDVYVIKSPLSVNRFKAKIMGPLVMYPASEDNYGYDACSILCLKTVPNCVVIATTNGVIYHSLVLDNVQEHKKAHSFEMANYEEPDIALYVFERIELSVSLTDEQDVFSHPIKLYKDITSKTKYHCSHVSGMHSVAVPFLLALEENLENADRTEQFDMESKPVSIVEHTVCTQPLPQMESIPVVGVDFITDDASVTLVCLLASWDVVCLSLVSSFFSRLPHLLLSDPRGGEDLRSSGSPFGDQIERTLNRSVCCPYLVSSLPAEDVPQQWLDLLCNVTQRYREDYVQRLNTAHALLRSRIKVLCQKKEYQLKDISKTLDEKDTLKRGAERLAEKYEDAQMHQQKLYERIESVLQRCQKSLPYLTEAEVHMKEQLLSHEARIESFRSSLKQIRRKLRHQESAQVGGASGDSVPSRRPDSALNLNEKQIRHIKEVLSTEGESISELMQSVTSLKKQICG